MASNWKPVAAIVCFLALVAWLASAVPSGAADATAKQSLRSPSLADQFVVLDDDDFDDDDFDEDERDGDDLEDGDEWDEGEESEGDDYGDEEEDWEEGWEEDGEMLEREMMYLEFHQAELHKSFGELELMQEVTKVVKDPEATAVLAVLTTLEEIDGPGRKQEFLEACLQRTSSAAVKRLVRLQLAEVYAESEQYDRAVETVLQVVGDE